MAEQLVQSLATEFEPAKFHDDYRERVLDLIARKAEGEEIAISPEVPAAAPVVDLMAALEASLAEARKEKGKDGKKRREGKELTA
jgi:DNA end-binding protein Ku